MNKTSIVKARTEAEEFVEKCNAVINDEESIFNVLVGQGDKKTGALRRQSLELTRALAEMRKP